MAHTYRVIPLPADTLVRLRSARDRARTTNRAWLLEATAARLPALVDSLRGLGFGAEQKTRKTARLPFDEETLAALKAGSAATGLPQTVLLQLVIDQHASTVRRTKRRTSKKRKGGQ